jgi:hypothetical protein
MCTRRHLLLCHSLDLNRSKASAASSIPGSSPRIGLLLPAAACGDRTSEIEPPSSIPGSSPRIGGLLLRLLPACLLHCCTQLHCP